MANQRKEIGPILMLSGSHEATEANVAEDALPATL